MSSHAKPPANQNASTARSNAPRPAVRRIPIADAYRGYEVLSMPPISSGGAAIVQMLNLLEHDDLSASGFGSSATVHLMIEAMRRAYADPGAPPRRPRVQSRDADRAPHLEGLRGPR